MEMSSSSAGRGPYRRQPELCCLGLGHFVILFDDDGIVGVNASNSKEVTASKRPLNTSPARDSAGSQRHRRPPAD
jgi:hypothetical protein